MRVRRGVCWAFMRAGRVLGAARAIDGFGQAGQQVEPPGGWQMHLPPSPAPALPCPLPRPRGPCISFHAHPPLLDLPRRRQRQPCRHERPHHARRRAQRRSRPGHGAHCRGAAPAGGVQRPAVLAPAADRAPGCGGIGRAGGVWGGAQRAGAGPVDQCPQLQGLGAERGPCIVE